MVTKQALRKKKQIKKKRPTFLRQEGKKETKLKKKWRKPKGITSKLRRHEKARGSLPGPGYGSPKETKHLNPQGYTEVLVSRPQDIAGIDPKKQMIIISSRVGRKKKLDILKAAETSGVKISNWKGYK